MSVTFDNLSFKRIILHNVYKPNAEGRVDPVKSQRLTTLDADGLQKLQERISVVLGRGSHCIQMEIATIGVSSCFHHASTMIDEADQAFIDRSGEFAELHTNAHTNQRWPEGTIVVIEATAGASNKRCIFVIKAEQQAGFQESERGDQVIMEFIDNLILTPQSKLYKIGAFVEIDQESLEQDTRSVSDFEIYVFDSNITAKDDRKAARYFYSNFLGLRIPDNAEQRTRDFYEYTTNFIKTADIPDSDRVDLQQALYTYLKTDQSDTIEVSSFSQSYLDEEIRDDYASYMENKDFPLIAVPKDIAIIKGKLRERKMRFSSKVKLIAPADTFNELVKIVDVSDEHTTLRIQGNLTDQD